MKNLLMAILLLMCKSLYANDKTLSMNLDEFEVREEVARKLNVNAQQIEVIPSAVEFVKASENDKVGLKGRLFITWTIKDTLQTNNEMTYTNSGVTFTSNGPALDGEAKGNINSSVRIGYQIFENLGIETAYERSSSTFSMTSAASGTLIGKATASSTTIHNDFQTIKVGLVSNANIYKGTSYRLDLVGSVNGGVIIANSTYRNEGDIYNGATGYSYGAEAGVRVLHKSGLYVSTGVGMNNKVLAPKTWQDGSRTQFNGSDKYVFINVGYSFGGKKRR